MSTYGKAETQWVYGNTGRSYLRFYWERQSSSISDNSSQIKWSVELYMDDTASYIKGNDITVTINGTKTTIVGAQKDISGGSLGRGTATIKHTAYGKGSFEVTLDGVLYGVSRHANVSTTFILDDIPRGAIITSAPNFTDTDNPTITYSNRAGNLVTSIEACISYDGSKDNIPYRSIPINGTSYTFDLDLLNSDGISYKNQMLKECKNSSTRDLYFFLRTKIGNDTLLYKAPAHYNIQSVPPEIVLSAKDTRAETVALTGDSSKIIKGQSTINAEITINPFKYATITEGSIYYDGVWTDMPGDLNSVKRTSTKPYATAADYKVWAIDSRGDTSTKSANLSLIPYFTPYCNIDAKLSDITDVNAYTDISFMGTFANINFGAKQNSVLLWYRYKLDNGTYGNWTQCNRSGYSISNNNVSAAVQLTTDYRHSVTIQGRITDELVTDGYITNSVTINPMPIFDWGKDGFNFNIPISINNVDIFDLIYPVGSIYTSVNNVNPSTLFGGTWVAFAQGRTLMGVKTTENGFKLPKFEGGERTHALTIDEMPKHNHRVMNNGNNNNAGAWKTKEYIWSSSTPDNTNGAYGNTGNDNNKLTTNYVGSGSAHNNLPPYITVYFWERTA